MLATPPTVSGALDAVGAMPWDDDATRTVPPAPNDPANFAQCNARAASWNQDYRHGSVGAKVNFGQLIDDTSAIPSPNYVVQPLPVGVVSTTVAPAAAGGTPTIRYDLDRSTEYQVPVPSFTAHISLDSVHPGTAPLQIDLNYDFGMVDWFGNTAAPAISEGWSYGAGGFYPRYPNAPFYQNANQRIFESVWPTSPTLSVKYKRMGYTQVGSTDVWTRAAYNTAGYRRALKYSLNIVTAGNLDVTSSGSAGSVTGSTTNTYDRDFNAGYFQGADPDVTARINNYAASHSLGDRNGGPAKYWNLEPLIRYINRGDTFMQSPTVPGGVTVSKNPWTDFEQWVNDEVLAGIRDKDKNVAVYVMHKFLYCDTRTPWTATTGAFGPNAVIDMSPKVILFYGYSTRKITKKDNVRMKWGYVTDWPDIST